ncbi:hypothetical protein HDU85_000959 [Gaertneriomyces sp. JEL0708]|nr:hypothetical protein HDU85_000959 [Gaertneriomyces sp. JEL0708]
MVLCTVAIIGAGPSGICAAIELKKQLGLTSFVIYEKSAAVGGTWYDNRYPGCACDIKSHLYSLSSEPNPDWTYAYSPSDEICRYYQAVAKKHDLLDYVRFRTTVVAATWDDTEKIWRLKLRIAGDNGAVEDVDTTANIVLSGMGAINRPSYPNIPGIDKFMGLKMHTAEWDPEISLARKRVAVIGTAASAVQLIPQLQRQVDKLVVFQRTPTWIVPRGDYKYSTLAKWIFRYVPGVRWVYRMYLYLFYELRHPVFRVSFVRKMAEKYYGFLMRRQIREPEMREKLMPKYALGCKRVVVSDEYLPAMCSPNVDVVTTGISHITETGIADINGTQYDVDAIVFATGFQTQDMYRHVRIVGKNGLNLLDKWNNGLKPEIYNGIACHGFPNWYFLLGPYTGLGHSSVMIMSELQIGFIMKLLRAQLQANVPYLEVSASAEKLWVDKVLRDLESTTWMSHTCKSWYQNELGIVTYLWPFTVTSYWHTLRRVKWDHWNPNIKPSWFARKPSARVVSTTLTAHVSKLE